jgi:hypothetical protein
LQLALSFSQLISIGEVPKKVFISQEDICSKVTLKFESIYERLTNAMSLKYSPKKLKIKYQTLLFYRILKLKIIQH